MLLNVSVQNEKDLELILKTEIALNISETLFVNWIE
jgi:hypothetical protein